MNASGLIREAISRAGHRVTMSIEQASYQGARPFYLIARHARKGGGADLRYVPVVYGVLDDRHAEPAGQRRVSAEARALAVFEAFAQDVTDPASLLAGGGRDARSTLNVRSTTPRPAACITRARGAAGERLRAYHARAKTSTPGLTSMAAPTASTDARSGATPRVETRAPPAARWGSAAR